MPADEIPTWQPPTRSAAAWLHLRVAGHVLLRGLRNALGPAAPRHRAGTAYRDAPVLAERRTPLWRDGRDEEFMLVAGKVHNLRLARQAFDGVVIPAGCTFSFWRQLGRPSRRRGFVEGREVRAGCVVPTIAGGLCQLSNALAGCAVDAGLTLLERHAHSARIEAGPSLHQGPGQHVDATVFWNYVDLRLRADFDVRLEVELTGQELLVRLRGERAAAKARRTLTVAIVSESTAMPVARGCLTCDETACFRHQAAAAPRLGGTTAVLLNAWTPELHAHLPNSLDHRTDWFMPWVRPTRRAAGTWTPPPTGCHHVALVASLRRMVLLRCQRGEAAQRQAALAQADRWLAEWYAGRLAPWHTHLVIDQSLLVPLWQRGHLGGRTYDVWVPTLPVVELQRRLDRAAQRWPQAESLRDFRIAPAEAGTELAALRGARRLITSHAEVARCLATLAPGVPIDPLPWQLPPSCSPMRPPPHAAPQRPPTVVFPASALARKGALELAEALRQLGGSLIVLGTPSSDPTLWHGIEVMHLPYRDPTWLARADVVALPAHVEHAPRSLLAALAHGLPVVASAACGLPAALGAVEVQAGDVPGLVAALRHALHRADASERPLPPVKLHPPPACH